MYSWTEFVRKLLTLIMPLVISVNGVAVTLPAFAASLIDAQVVYDFADDEPGSAEGTVTVSGKMDGVYSLYWGDDGERKLFDTVSGRKVYYTEFVDVDVDSGSGTAEVLDFTAIPDGAETVLIFKGKILCGSEDIPDEKLPDRGGELYVFGALSDVHFNRYKRSLADDSRLTFRNALDFLDGCGVSLVGMSGDLSNRAEKESFIEFNKYASEQSFPVYTCTGNHDCHTANETRFDDWRQYINTGVYGEEKREGVELAPDGLSFVYAPSQAGGDVFIFLSQLYWDYGREDSKLLESYQLDWLERQLEKHSDVTVYLFFHTFLADDKGNEELGEGNMVNSGGATYDLVYTPGTSDEVRFRELLKENKNVIFLNGHSHWSYDMQKYNPGMNVTDYDGTYCTMVHVSSVSSPRSVKRDTSEDVTENNLLKSEGLLVKVYEDRIVFTAVDFLRGVFLSYATFTVDR